MPEGTVDLAAVKLVVIAQNRLQSLCCLLSVVVRHLRRARSRQVAERKHTEHANMLSVQREVLCSCVIVHRDALSRLHCPTTPPEI